MRPRALSLVAGPIAARHRLNYAAIVPIKITMRFVQRTMPPIRRSATQSMRRKAGGLLLTLLALMFAGACSGDRDRTAGMSGGMGMGWGTDPDGSSGDASTPAAPYLGEITHVSLKSPARLAIGPDNTLVVTDPRAHAVHLFGLGGSYRRSIPVTNPLGCTVDAAGRIYVGDRASGSVRIYNASGMSLGVLGTGDGEFSMPNALAYDAAGNSIYVADSQRNTVRVYSTSGAFVSAIGGIESDTLSFPTGLAVDPTTRHLFVADHNRGRVQVFDKDGQLLSSIGSYGSDPGQLTRPQGLALDPHGRLYVADAFHGEVRAFGADGSAGAPIGEYGKGPGQLVLPTDVVIDRYGRLLVSSYDTGRVLIFGLEGYAAPDPDPLIATVDVIPRALIVPLGGEDVLLFIEVPGQDASTIDRQSVRINTSVAPDLSLDSFIVDRDRDGTNELAIKFSRSQLVAELAGVGKHELVATGRLSSGALFEARTSVSVSIAAGALGNGPRSRDYLLQKLMLPTLGGIVWRPYTTPTLLEQKPLLRNVRTPLGFGEVLR